MIPLLAIKTALGGAWGFISKLPATTIVIAVLCAVSAFLWHNADGWKARDARHAAAYRDEIVAGKVMAKSIDDLQRAVDVQNAAVETERKASVAAYVQAIAARDKARADSVSSLALADRFNSGPARLRPARRPLKSWKRTGYETPCYTARAIGLHNTAPCR